VTRERPNPWGWFRNPLPDAFLASSSMHSTTAAVFLTGRAFRPSNGQSPTYRQRFDSTSRAKALTLPDGGSRYWA
jgi:hypothetical protein